MRIEVLESLLDDIRSKHHSINQLLEFKEITNPYDPEVKKMIKLYCPNLERNCLIAITAVTDLTEENGHRPEYDYIKDTAFEVYGKCIGVEL